MKKLNTTEMNKIMGGLLLEHAVYNEESNTYEICLDNSGTNTNDNQEK